MLRQMLAALAEGNMLEKPFMLFLILILAALVGIAWVFAPGDHLMRLAGVCYGFLLGWFIGWVEHDLSSRRARREGGRGMN